MDMQSTLNIISLAFMTVVGWFGKILWDMHTKTKAEITQMRIDLPMHYVLKSDIDAQFNKLEANIQRILDKLENKADKP